MADARFDDEIVDPGSVTDFSSSSVTSSDCSVAYDSDGEPAMVVNRIAEVGLREAYKYKPTLTDSGAEGEQESDSTGRDNADA